MSIAEIGTASLISAFDAFDVHYRNKGVKANIDLWMANKLHIIEKLRKHPNWCEEALAVVMNITEKRGDDEMEARSALEEINYYLYSIKILPEAADIVRELSPYLLQKHIAQDCVDKAAQMAVPPPITPSVGMKSSRYIRKLCESYGVDVDGDADFRVRFTRFADTISPYDIVRPYLFSVNPADYALMSNGNSWSSCHCIAPSIMGSGDYGGEYRAGCFSYMNDGSTIVSYTVEKLPEDMSAVYLEPKYSRQLYYLADDGKMFIQSRAYPSATLSTRREMRRVAHSIISTVYGFDNLWGKPNSHGDDYANQVDSRHYPDYYHFSEATRLSYAAEIKAEIEAGERHSSIPIGDTPVCLACGEHSMQHSGTLYCCHCCDDDMDDTDDGDY